MRTSDRQHSIAPAAVRFAVLALASLVQLATAVATVGATTIPDSLNCTVPAVLVATGSGATVGSGYAVVVRDSSNAIIANAYVTFDFRGTGMTPYADQPSGITPEPGYCQLLTVRTDSTGTAHFSPRLSGHENSNLIVVWARKELCDAGVSLKHIKGRSTDIVTSVAAGNRWGTPENTGLADLTAFTTAFYTTHAQECDFNNDGSVGLADFSIFSSESFIAYSALLCVP